MPWWRWWSSLSPPRRAVSRRLRGAASAGAPGGRTGRRLRLRAAPGVPWGAERGPGRAVLHRPRPGPQEGAQAAREPLPLRASPSRRGCGPSRESGPPSPSSVPPPRVESAACVRRRAPSAFRQGQRARCRPAPAQGGVAGLSGPVARHAGGGGRAPSSMRSGLRSGEANGRLDVSGAGDGTVRP